MHLLLEKIELKIVAEHYHKVEHHLMTKKDVSLKNINKEFFSIFRKNLNFSMEKIEVKKLLSRYVDDANDSGIDLSLYNTFQSAVDLDLIMQNLNINKYNLYGSSYGTRLGRIIQELFPERLNAVILNSPNPLDGGDMLLGCLLYTSPSPRDRH